MKSKHLLSALSLLVMCAPSAPAIAQASALATLENAGYWLVDLNPGDGIAPRLSLSVPGVSLETTLFNNPKYDPDGALREDFNDRAMAGVINSDGFSQAVSSTGYTLASVYTHVNSAIATGQTTWDFVLSANTRVVFFADAMVDVQLGGADGFAYAQAQISGTVGNESNGGALHFSNSLDARDGRESAFLETRVSSGASDTAGTVQVLAFASAAAAATIPPVPEPASCVMLLAGLAALATRLCLHRVGRRKAWLAARHQPVAVR
jgi:hypothetical protein